MKVQLGVTTQEGFKANWVLRFPHADFRSFDNMLWVGQEKKAEILDSMRKTIADLEAAGIEVEGKELLDEN